MPDGRVPPWPLPFPFAPFPLAVLMRLDRRMPRGACGGPRMEDAANVGLRAPGADSADDLDRPPSTSKGCMAPELCG